MVDVLPKLARQRIRDRNFSCIGFESSRSRGLASEEPGADTAGERLRSQGWAGVVVAA